MNVMPISEIIEKVTMICKKNNVKRLDLFGSFATGTATPTSDIDFIVYGCDNLMQLEDDLQQIETLRKIDIFDFDSIKNEYLLEDIKKIWKTNLLTAITLSVKVSPILQKAKQPTPRPILFSKELFSISVLLSTSPGKL